MNHEAPGLLVALEGSGVGQAIRQSVWIYPTANVLHIIALVLFAGAVAIMDLRLLGAFSATRPADVIDPARRFAISALLLLAVSGLILFTAEASHVALNSVFQIKAVLITIGVLNALLIARIPTDVLAKMAPGVALPGRIRSAALFSLIIWISVAACGRLIAYF